MPKMCGAEGDGRGVLDGSSFEMLDDGCSAQWRKNGPFVHKTQDAGRRARVSRVGSHPDRESTISLQPERAVGSAPTPQSD